MRFLKVKETLKTLRANGVIVVGIGVTKDGKAALNTYAPEARLVEKAENLALTLADLLKEHLANI